MWRLSVYFACKSLSFFSWHAQETIHTLLTCTTKDLFYVSTCTKQGRMNEGVLQKCCYEAFNATLAKCHITDFFVMFYIVGICTTQ